MSLISVLDNIARRLGGFQSEEEKQLLHDQIHALGDEAITDVRSLVHGVETDAVTDFEAGFREVQTPPPATEQTPPPPPADPLAGMTDAELEAEIQRRKAAAGQ